MLDLSKPIAPVNGVTLYGDHADADLVYVFPDEISLTEGPSGPDLDLRIFAPEEAIVGGADVLDRSVGAILTLGVRCGIAPERLEEIRRSIVARDGRSNARVALPTWEDGKVELVILDATSGRETPPSTSGAAGANVPEPLVGAITGTRRPSITDGSLRAVFHVRLDRIGAALTIDALRREGASAAAVGYDLTYLALRPSYEARLWADLDRCADFVRASLGVSVYYVGVNLGFVWDKMREAGLVHSDVKLFDEDPEAQRVLSDFRDQLLKALFQPTISPLASVIGGAAAGGGATGGGASIVSLSVTYGRSEHERRIEVDYRQRAASRRTHDPRAQLHAIAASTPEGTFVHRVAVGEAWRRFEVEVACGDAFAADPLLRRIGARIFRARDGVETTAPGGETTITVPSTARPLAEIDFTKEDAAARKIAWVLDPDEPPTYLWSARLAHAPADGVDAPVEIETPFARSGGADLDLDPVLLTPARTVELRLDTVLPGDLAAVDVHLVARDRANALVAERTVTLDAPPAEPAAKTWAVRRAVGDGIRVYGAPTYRFTDGRTLAVAERVYSDRDVRVRSPFVATRTLLPLVVDPATPDLAEVDVTFTYEDAAAAYRHEARARLLPPDFRGTDVVVPVLTADATVRFAATAIDRAGATRPIAEGVSSGGTVAIRLAGGGRRVRLTWVGAPPAERDLVYVRATLRLRADDGAEVERRVETFEGRAEPAVRELVLGGAGRLELAVERRFTNGEITREDFRPVTGADVPISAGA